MFGVRTKKKFASTVKDRVHISPAERCDWQQQRKVYATVCISEQWDTAINIKPLSRRYRTLHTRITPAKERQFHWLLMVLISTTPHCITQCYKARAHRRKTSTISDQIFSAREIATVSKFEHTTIPLRSKAQLIGTLTFQSIFCFVEKDSRINLTIDFWFLSSGRNVFRRFSLLARLKGVVRDAWYFIKTICQRLTWSYVHIHQHGRNISQQTRVWYPDDIALFIIHSTL